MVEVLVAFLVLMIVLGILYGMIAFASILRMRAQDASLASQSFVREMYDKGNAPEQVPEGSSISAKTTTYDNIIVRNYETRDSVPLFYLELNTDETSAANLGTRGADYYNTISSTSEEEEIIEKQENYWLSLYNIEAITYVYRPGSSVDTEHIIIPKAVKFIHKEDRDGEN